MLFKVQSRSIYILYIYIFILFVYMCNYVYIYIYIYIHFVWGEYFGVISHPCAQRKGIISICTVEVQIVEFVFGTLELLRDAPFSQKCFCFRLKQPWIRIFPLQWMYAAGYGRLHKI